MRLYQKVKELQISGNEEALQDIITKFEPKVKSLIRQTSRQDQEDLMQELKITIVLKSINYPLDEVPGFEEFKKKTGV